MKSFTPTSRYRSNLASIQDHAQISGGKKSAWGLRDVLRSKKEQEQRSAIADTFRARADHRDGTDGPKRKVTVVKRFKKRFHATGLGNLSDITFGEVKTKARTHGYTHLLWAGRMVSLA